MNGQTVWELMTGWLEVAPEVRDEVFRTVDLHWLKEHVAESRPPDAVIGEPDDPYLHRWWVVPRNKSANLYLHRFMKSDDDRALHDHPWWNVSRILEGSYSEIMPATEASTNIDGLSYVPDRPLLRSEQRRLCDIVYREAIAAHRIVLTNGPVWSLFMTGPVQRSWGFYCPRGWVHWREFTAVDRDGHSGRIGRGCD